MTDNEIIKALECCSVDDCSECPYAVERLDELGCDVNIHMEALTLVNRLKLELAKHRGKSQRRKIELTRMNDVVNRQKAEIERLQHILVSFMTEVDLWGNKHNIDTGNIAKIAVLGTEKSNIIKQTKAEAIQAFAVRLSEKAEVDEDNHWWVSSADINNLVKEMVEGVRTSD